MFVNKKALVAKRQEEQRKMLEQIKDKRNKMLEKIDQHNTNVRKLRQYNQKNIPFPLKTCGYESVVPLDIWTCWHTYDLPPKMRENIEKLKQDHPAFQVHLYDEEQCRAFLKEHFDPEVVNAYDTLIPSAYKADLWRYAILYIRGGIYIDIKYHCVNNFSLMALTEKEYFVRDRWDLGTYNALIVCQQGNIIMKQCIDRIVENVKNRFYGDNALHPTGPTLLGSFFSKKEIDEMELSFEDTTFEDTSVLPYAMKEEYIVFNGYIIMKKYTEYRQEQFLYGKNSYIFYSELWVNKNIYLI
jgi:mannosyltransferase OCH1-like enzyme